MSHHLHLINNCRNDGGLLDHTRYKSYSSLGREKECSYVVWGYTIWYWQGLEVLDLILNCVKLGIYKTGGGGKVKRHRLSI